MSKSRVKRTCTAEWPGGRCGRPAAVKDLCHSHYYQWHNGREIQPLRTLRPRGEKLAFIRLAAVAPGPDCMMLVDANGRRTTIRFESQPMPAARAAYAIANGLSIQDIKDQQVLHKCNGGTGVSGCVLGAHLYLGTHADNMRDKALAERGHGTRLSCENVRDIAGRHKGGVGGNTAALAAEFGVTEQTINALAGRRRRRHCWDDPIHS